MKRNILVRALALSTKHREARIIIALAFSIAAQLCLWVPNTPAASIDSEIWWEEVLHDPFDSVYRTQDPIEAGDIVRLRLRTAESDLTSAGVYVRDVRTNTEFYFSMEWDANFDVDATSYDWWYFDLSVGNQPTDLWYFFELNDQADQDFYVQLWQIDGTEAIPLGNGTMIESYESGLSFGIDVGNWNICMIAQCDPPPIPAPVPEPATIVLFGAGLAGIAGAARRKKNRRA